MSTISEVVATNVSVVNAAETALASSDNYPYNNPAGEGLKISGVININPTGATTTAVVIRVRKGVGVAGTVVGAARTHTIGAAAAGSIPFEEVDAAPTNPSQYTVTIVQTGGSSTGTVTQATISLSPASSVPG